MFITHALCSPSPTSLAEVNTQIDTNFSMPLTWIWRSVESSLRREWERSVFLSQRRLLARRDGEARNRCQPGFYDADTRVADTSATIVMKWVRTTFFSAQGSTVFASVREDEELRMSPHSLPQKTSSWRASRWIKSSPLPKVLAEQARLFPQNNHQSHPPLVRPRCKLCFQKQQHSELDAHWFASRPVFWARYCLMALVKVFSLLHLARIYMGRVGMVVKSLWYGTSWWKY